MLNLDELERLEKAATPGEWYRVAYWIATNNPYEGHGRAVTDAEGINISDADLIVAARNALPALIERARRADELEQAQRWIPVRERLPDEGELVQWYAPGNDDDSYSVGKLDGSSVCEFARDRYPLAIYTHWMPLPAPPEVE